MTDDFEGVDIDRPAPPEYVEGMTTIMFSVTVPSSMVDSQLHAAAVVCQLTMKRLYEQGQVSPTDLIDTGQLKGVVCVISHGPAAPLAPRTYSDIYSW